MIDKVSTRTSKGSSKVGNIENTIICVCLTPQGMHSIMPLDLIHLQKSGAGCKARFTVDSDHEKASFPPTFHTDKELPHLHSMWESELWICMWDRGTPLKNKHSPWMNIYVCFSLIVPSKEPYEKGQASIWLRRPAPHPTLEGQHLLMYSF